MIQDIKNLYRVNLITRDGVKFKDFENDLLEFFENRYRTVKFIIWTEPDSLSISLRPKRKK